MKRILVCVALMVLAAFACTKKLEYKGVDKMPYLLVNIDYSHIGGDCANIEEWSESAKFYRKNGYRWLYYSSLDSNILVLLTSVPNDNSNMAMYLIRTCQSDEECEAQASENDILETFKYEFMRLQKNGAYEVSEEYADSVSNHIIDKLNEYAAVDTSNSTLSYVVYNCQDFNAYYEFNDKVTVVFPDYPDYFTEEIDSCNAYLESLEAQPLARIAPANFDVQVNSGVLSIVSSQNLKTVSILSPLGRLLEEHHVAGTSATVQLHLPAGTYIALVKTANNAIARKITVK